MKITSNWITKKKKTLSAQFSLNHVDYHFLLYIYLVHKCNKNICTSFLMKNHFYISWLVFMVYKCNSKLCVFSLYLSCWKVPCIKYINKTVYSQYNETNLQCFFKILLSVIQRQVVSNGQIYSILSYQRKPLLFYSVHTACNRAKLPYWLKTSLHA